MGHFTKQKKKKRKKEINDRLIEDRIIRDIRTFFQQEEEKDYYKARRVSSFWNNNYIEYESNGNKNRKLSLDEYTNKKIEPYLRNIITDLQNSDTWKIRLAIAINFISSKDVEEDRVMHSRSDNTKLTFYSHGNGVVDEVFDSLL